MSCTKLFRCTRPISRVAVSPDNNTVAFGVRCDLGSVTVQPTKFSLYWDLDDVTCMAFSPACVSPLLLATGSSNCTVNVWDCKQETLVKTLQGGFDYIDRIGFSPDGRLLAAAYRYGGLRLWQTANGLPLATPLSNQWVAAEFCMSFSRDSRMLASFSDSFSYSLKVWHIRDSAVAPAPAAAPAAPAVAAAAAAATAAATAIAVAAIARTPAAIADAFVAAVAADVAVFPGQTLKCKDSLVCITFSPVDNMLLACGGSRGFAAIVKVGDASLVVRHELVGHVRCVRCVAFSPCGKELASGSDDHTVRLWSLASGACLRVLQGYNNVRDIAYFPNGKQLLSSTFHEGTSCIWTLCAWTDRTHHLFSEQLKATVFTLMCVRARLEQAGLAAGLAASLPRLPMEVWLLVFMQSHLAHDRAFEQAQRALRV